VTDVPGCRQSIIEDKTGWLCEVKSADSLASKLRHAIKMDNMSLEVFSLNARSFVVENRSEKLVIDQYMQCLERF
jgi:glycosyltransferase involved in cell wall biosynthesis